MAQDVLNTAEEKTQGIVDPYSVALKKSEADSYS
jgi:hypothetical protein